MFKTVAFVPIKLNSQRLPGKNLLPLGAHALCHYIFETLLQCKGIDRVFVYCSDSAIMNYLPNGVHFKSRSKNLDANETKGMEIYESFVSEIDADVYVLAHATSPYIKEKTIDEALSKVLSEKYDSAFSARKEQTFCWYMGAPLNYSLEDIVRTQEIEPVFIETSGFYIFKKSVLTDLKRRIGNKPWISIVSGSEAIDIDTKDDYELALAYLERGKSECEL